MTLPSIVTLRRQSSRIAYKKRSELSDDPRVGGHDHRKQHSEYLRLRIYTEAIGKTHNHRHPVVLVEYQP
jgi:hypothetical protein